METIYYSSYYGTPSSTFLIILENARDISVSRNYKTSYKVQAVQTKLLFILLAYYQHQIAKLGKLLLNQLISSVNLPHLWIHFIQCKFCLFYNCKYVNFGLYISKKKLFIYFCTLIYFSILIYFWHIYLFLYIYLFKQFIDQLSRKMYLSLLCPVHRYQPN